MPAAAVRPGTLMLVFLFLFFLVTLADVMRSTDVFSHLTLSWHVTSDVSPSRATGSLIRMSPVSVSRDSYCTCMCHGDPPGPSLCHAYVFLITFLTHHRLCRLVSCPGSSCAQFSTRRLYHLFTYPTGRYFHLVLLRTLRLFVLVLY